MCSIRQQGNCGRPAGLWMMGGATHTTAGQAMHRYPVVVVGLGHTGLSCARLLHREGVKFAVTDTRETPPCLAAARAELPDVPLYLGGLNQRMLCQAMQLVVSPGLDPLLPELRSARECGVDIMGDIELFRLRARAPVVAVTGSNGKSTVVSLFADMARRAGLQPGLGGNVGRPALELLDEGCGMYVLELSSFQLESVSTLGAEVALLLNIAPDHLDRYPDLESYATAKSRIYTGCKNMVINLDDSRVRGMRQPDTRMYTYTVRGRGADGFGLVKTRHGLCLAEAGRVLLPISELQIPGLHNAANCLAALALGRAMGLPEVPMLEALVHFAGLPHRMQWVGRQNGVDWYNDSKATNSAAASAALFSLGDAGRQVVLLAGGEAKEKDFTGLVQAARGRIRAAVLLGRDAPCLKRWLAHIAPLEEAHDMEDAVHIALRLAQPGDAVLLSPACASFDMYRDYRERGDAFVAAVRALPGVDDR